MRWQKSAPLGAQALLGKHEHIEGLVPQVLERVAQCGGPRMGIATQPPLGFPMQNELNMVPAGQTPASFCGTHCGAAPHRLVDGWTQNWSAPQVAPPQSESPSN